LEVEPEGHRALYPIFSTRETRAEPRPPKQSPSRTAKVLERGRLDALGHAPVTVQAGESVSVNFGYVRAPLGALVAWGETHGTVFIGLHMRGRDQPHFEAKRQQLPPPMMGR